MTPRHWPRSARLPRLRLRTKVSVFFALLALVATVSLSTVTYTLARSSLLDQRTSAAESLAVSNARKVFDQLRAGGFTEDQKFQDIVRPEPDGFNLAHAGAPRSRPTPTPPTPSRVRWPTPSPTAARASSASASATSSTSGSASHCRR